MMSGISSNCDRLDAGGPSSFFQKMDGDGDGKVTKQEMKATFDERTKALGAAGGSPRGAGKSVDEIFAEVDANGDDFIDEQEDESFRANHHAERLTHQQQSLDLMRQLLSSLDADQDGTISSSELASLFSQHEEDSTSTFSATA